MLRKLLATTSVLVLVTAASADITGSVVQVSTGTLINAPNVGTPYFSYDLKVTITGSDAWTVAGGPAVGTPWITLSGGTFYQNASNDTNPPNPAFMGIPGFEDSQWTSMYTTHLGWPNVATTGVSPGFAYGPADTPTALNADWFWTPDGNDYPGTFTVARFTILENVPGTPACATINMQIGSREIGVVPFQASVCTPEPGSLALLALGGLALIRRR
jgi:hypothetical protein